MGTEIIIRVTYISHSQVVGLTVEIILASASRYFYMYTRFEEKVRYEGRRRVLRYDTLCLRKPPDRPAC